MEPDYRQRARERVKEEKGFYSHLFIYIIINGFLIALNLITSPNSLWFYWPLLGWGIGLAAHFLGVFGMERFFGKDWEQRRIKKYEDIYREDEHTDRH